MANQRPRTAQQLARVAELRERGMTGPQIAKEMRLSTTRVEVLQGKLASAER